MQDLNQEFIIEEFTISWFDIGNTNNTNNQSIELYSSELTEKDVIKHNPNIFDYNFKKWYLNHKEELEYSFTNYIKSLNNIPFKVTYNELFKKYARFIYINK